MQRPAAHSTQPLESTRPDRRVPRELPNSPLLLQRAPHEKRPGKQRPAICERRVWGLARAARQAPTAHTRAQRAPLSVSGNHNPQSWTQQAPQPCAPTSKALTLSSTSLIALPESELQKTNKHKQKHEAAPMEEEFGLRDPAAPVAGRPVPERLASEPSLSPFLTTALRAPASVTHAARGSAELQGPT